MKLRLVFAGRSYEAAMVLPESLELAESATLDDALAAVSARLGRPLPASCLVALSGRHLGTVGEHRAAALADDDELLLLAPVAGG